MNEVTKIHLGRQAFTISVEAHQALRTYLDAIEKQVSDKDVMNEVELRMAELLAEHGISGDKVILPTDVSFLKEQLGNPKDFKEDDSEIPVADKTADTKRLYRDTNGAMIAGVATGIATYFGVDVLLIRIIFVIGVLTGGWGILLYIVLWLLVPEAKTSSDRLQMVGKPVTIGSLKEVVDRADVKGAAHRANRSVAGPINTFFSFVLKLVGLVFIVTGLGALLGLITTGTYILLHTGSLLQDNIFPIGLREHLLLDIFMLITALIALFFVLFGMAMFRRKWPIRGWITGCLVGLAFISLATGSALAGDVFPAVRDRYNANVHTTVRLVQPFSSVNIIGDGVDIRYQIANTYSVSLNYYDNPDLAAIKTTVANGTLLIDSQQFDWHRNCPTICVPNTYNMVITIDSPTLPQNAEPLNDPPMPPDGTKIYMQ